MCSRRVGPLSQNLISFSELNPVMHMMLRMAGHIDCTWTSHVRWRVPGAERRASISVGPSIQPNKDMDHIFRELQIIYYLLGIWFSFCLLHKGASTPIIIQQELIKVNRSHL
jgi:hypothetical protein